MFEYDANWSYLYGFESSKSEVSILPDNESPFLTFMYAYVLIYISEAYRWSQVGSSPLTQLRCDAI